MARDFTQVDIEGYSTLILTEKARAVLSGSEKVFFRKDLRPVKKKGKRVRRRAEPPASSPEGALFEELKQLRLAVAKAQSVPPYVIFHDVTLKEMAATLPGTLEEMRYISGVGEKKLEKYGQSFLEKILDHKPGPAGRC